MFAITRVERAIAAATGLELRPDDAGDRHVVVLKFDEIHEAQKVFELLSDLEDESSDDAAYEDDASDAMAP